MKKDKSLIKVICVTGFAMFSMFFGAGNLIFPPALGVMAGHEWLVAFIGFFVMDVGLSVLGVLCSARQNGDLSKFTEKLGTRVGNAVMIAVALCVGPFVVIPRTGAVTYSMGIQPLLGDHASSPMVLFIFSIVFFAVVLLLTIKPGKVVDIVGAYMTPILLIFIILLSILGIVTAGNGVGDTLIEHPIKVGVLNGYQTMDGMGAVLIAGVLIISVQKTRDEKTCRSIISISSILAAFLLLLVYGGLTYVGALWGQPMAETFMSGDLDQAGLLTYIVYRIMGRFGVYVIAIITLLACLTTAIGLSSAVAGYFETLTRNKVSYKTFAILICACGALLCNVGLSTILKVAQPILTVLYPVIVVLLVMNMLNQWIPERLPTILGSVVAFLAGLMSMFCDTLKISAFSFMHRLPMDSLGLNFVIPATCAVLVGIAICRLSGSHAHESTHK